MHLHISTVQSENRAHSQDIRILEFKQENFLLKGLDLFYIPSLIWKLLISFETVYFRENLFSLFAKII
jgi:hypothetical protein